MLINRAFKVELKPTPEVVNLFERYAGTSRFVYNWGLRRCEEVYKATGKRLTAYDLSKEITQLKKSEFSWMREISKYVPVNSLLQLEAAYQNFYRNLKKGVPVKDAGLPRKKAPFRKSFKLGGPIYIEEDRIKVPRIGYIELKEKGYIPISGIKINSITITSRVGRWFGSVQVEMEIPQPKEGNSPKKAIGIDLGLRTLATCSDGDVVERVRFLDRYAKRLRRYQRRYSKLYQLAKKKKKEIDNKSEEKKIRGNWKNLEKMRKKIEKLHYRIDNIRKDYINKMTSRILSKDADVYILEDLCIKNMTKRSKLKSPKLGEDGRKLPKNRNSRRAKSRSFHDAALREFRRQMEYKGAWLGKKIVASLGGMEWGLPDSQQIFSFLQAL